MIAIVSSLPRERLAFASLCESRRWPCAECASLREFRKLLRRASPTVVLTRHRLLDGYSDDLMRLLRSEPTLFFPKVMVLLDPGTRAAEEARQVSAGADTVHRDPVHAEVLVEYLGKFRRSQARERRARPRDPSRAFSFAGATVRPIDRTVSIGSKKVSIAPREMELIELLADFPGQLVSYSTLYSELLGRSFRGDTSNLRVLLGKLCASFLQLGLPLRTAVQVIPKTGYRYQPPGGPTPRPPRGRRRRSAGGES